MKMGDPFLLNNRTTFRGVCAFLLNDVRICFSNLNWFEKLLIVVLMRGSAPPNTLCRTENIQ